MPFSIGQIPDHEVIEVSMCRPYQPYEQTSASPPWSFPSDTMQD
jgi:hypothetical protein